MKSNNTFYKVVLAIEPIFIFVCVKELVKLIVHNLAMNFSANDVTAFGVYWGQFKTFQEVTNFLQSKLVYIGILSNLILLVIIGLMYLGHYKKRKVVKSPGAVYYLKALVATVCIGLVVDNLITISGLRGSSEKYQTVVQSTADMSFWIMIAATVILAPIVEELVFRGLVYTRCRELFGVIPATVISAACFGLVHGNLVQFIYAGIIGVFLCIFYEKGRSVWVPIICHMAVNMVALLSNYYGIFSWMYTNNMTFIGALLVYTGLSVILVGNLRRRK